MHRHAGGVLWALAYILVVSSPLLFMAVRPVPPARPFLLEASVALGFVAILMMAIQFVLIGRFQSMSAPFGIDVLLRYHRRIAAIALAFVVLHSLMLVVHDPALAATCGRWRCRPMDTPACASCRVSTATSSSAPPTRWTSTPFSFSSSSETRGRLEFAIKELGDFTNRIGQVPPGTTAFIDGPHGSFSTDLTPAPGYVFIAGGIGIAPFMSLVRTLADRGDPRPVLLL